MKLFVSVFFTFVFTTSCTNFHANRKPNSSTEQWPSPIPLDVHQHYVPNSDGFLGALHECANDEADIEAWESFRAQFKKPSQIEAFDKEMPKPILGEIKKSCSPDFPTVQEILSQRELQHTLLISQSFTIDENKPGRGIQNWAKTQNIEAINQHVSNISQENTDRISGLCGLNYAWSHPRYQKEIQACEKMSGLIGYKFYWDATVESTSPSALKNLNYFFNAMKGKKRIVLWHFDFPAIKGSIERSEAVLTRFKALEAWTTKNPNIYFIFAHGFYSPNLVWGLFQFENWALLHSHNIFFDLSASNSYLKKDEMLKVAEVARRVGIWRFLFGTDGVEIEKSYAMYRDKFGFNEAEVEQVVYKNGHNFLKKVIEPIKLEKN